jgi:hypothetical protein
MNRPPLLLRKPLTTKRPGFPGLSLCSDSPLTVSQRKLIGRHAAPIVGYVVGELRRGVPMKYRVMAAGAAAIVMAAVAAAPVAGAQTTTWEMPDLEDANLAAAVSSFSSATEGSGLTLRFANRSGPGEVINLTNWTVCAQSPAAGTTLTAKSRPIVGVNRPNQCG